MRLFFALWPSEAVRQSLAAHRLDVTRLTGGRPTTPVTLHVTLVFVGDVPAARLPDVIAVGKAIKQAPFDYRINTAGCFASAKVAWLGADTTPTPLLALQESLNRGVAQADFEIDTRAFRPHITIARHIDTDYEPFPVREVVWPVNDFCLVSGHSDGTEVRYHEIERWRLR